MTLFCFPETFLGFRDKVKVRVRVRVGVRVEVRVIVSGNTFENVFGQTSVRASTVYAILFY